MMRKRLSVAVGVCLLLASAMVFLGCPNQQIGGSKGRQQDNESVSGRQQNNSSGNETTQDKGSNSLQLVIQLQPQLGGNTESGGEGSSSQPSGGEGDGDTESGGGNSGQPSGGTGGTSQGGGQISSGADFSFVDNKDGTVTCTASVIGATAYNYSWLTHDEQKTGETVTLSLQGGKQTITLYVDIDGKWENPLTVTKTVNVGVTYTDKVFLFTNAENEQQYMYFAIKVKGSSSSGLFRQKVAGDEYAYARDLHAQVSVPVATINGKPTEYSNFNGEYVTTLCTQYNICVAGYNEKTGFATEDGKSFEFPFYYGDDNFRVSRNGNNTLNFVFEAFVIRDTTKPGLLPGLGHPSFASIHGSNKLTLPIPMEKFDVDKHKNIALFTINFENYEKGTEFPKVIFDGFVEK